MQHPYPDSIGGGAPPLRRLQDAQASNKYLGRKELCAFKHKLNAWHLGTERAHVENVSAANAKYIDDDTGQLIKD